MGGLTLRGGAHADLDEGCIVEKRKQCTSLRPKIRKQKTLEIERIAKDTLQSILSKAARSTKSDSLGEVNSPPIEVKQCPGQLVKNSKK